MKSAWDRGEDIFDPARKEDFFGRRQNGWNGGKSVSKTRWRHWRKHWNVSRIFISVGIQFHNSSLPTFVVAMSFSIVGAKLLQNRSVGRALLGRRLAYSGPMERCGFCAQQPSVWNVPVKYGPHGELFFFFHREGAFCSHKGSEV